MLPSKALQVHHRAASVASQRVRSAQRESEIVFRSISDVPTAFLPQETLSAARTSIASQASPEIYGRIALRSLRRSSDTESGYFTTRSPIVFKLKAVFSGVTSILEVADYRVIREASVQTGYL